MARRADLVIAETTHGFVCANAGIDASNVAEGFLSLLPEASTFTRAEFGSTRTDPTLNPATTEPVGAPRLRITYQRPFPFENP